MLVDIHPSKETMMMSTNAGVKRLGVQGHLESFGSAYYDPDLLANIVGFAALINKGYKITYNSEQ